MDPFIIRTEEIKDGNVIVEEGTWAYYVYVLQSGKAKVWKTINNKQVQIGTLKKGDIFGEMSFFGITKRTATVTADGDVKVGMISKDAFVEALDKLPKGVRAKLDKMTHDLFYLNDAYSRLTNCLHEILNIKQRMIDPKIFEKEIEKMPDILRKVVIMMSQRFAVAVEGSAKMVAQMEEISKYINSLSMQ
jgi:CRP-like cAMP-binding protein